jgi:hypothetical protein
MKSRLRDAIQYLSVVLGVMPLSAGAVDNMDTSTPAGQGIPASDQLSEFFSMESILIVVFVFLILALIAHKTKSP